MNLPEGVSIEQLVKVYNDYKRRNEERSKWFQTDEGKAYNRMKAKEYYSRNKEKIAEKRAKRYEQERDLLLERAKEYYKNHADEVNAKAREKRKIENTPV